MHISQLTITISCIYLFLTPNSQSVFRAGVSLNIDSFIPNLQYSKLVPVVKSTKQSDVIVKY